MSEPSSTDKLLDLDQIHARLVRRTPKVPTRLPAAVSEDELMQGYSAPAGSSPEAAATPEEP